MDTRRIFLLFLILFIVPLPSSDADTGKLTGGVKYSLPSWFKLSFLDFPEESGLLRSSGKHLLVFLHLDECPYCDRILKESFYEGDNKQFIQQHFEVIGVSFTGNKELTWTDGKVYSERELVRKVLKIYATPTIVFLNADGKKVAQLNGYRDPSAFRNVLEYVQTRAYYKQSLAAFIDSRKKPVVYQFKDHSLLANKADFKGYNKPVLILFEDAYCGECARFHETTLNHPLVMSELKPFLFVRLDTESSQKIVTFDGNVTTAGQWAKSMDLSYRPAMVMFNGGLMRFRSDGRLYKHHLVEALLYVSGANYEKYEKITDFKKVYRADLMRRGINVDFSE